MKRERSMFLAWAAGFALSCATGAAMVQSAAGAETEAVTGADQLEEVIVTAQRRAEDLQRTPVAVTAISGAELDREVIQSAVDLQGIAPGAIFISNTNIAVRGISNNAIGNNGVANDNSVGVFVDGLVNPRNDPGLLFDVQRTELLRGPQGTLYGRNNTAGALNIINNRPTDEFQGNVSAEVGNYARFSTQGMLNVPVSDALALRASYISIYHGAYQSDGYDTQDSLAGRLRVQIKPSDKVTVLLGLDYEHDAGLPSTPALYPPGSPNLAGIPYQPWLGTPLCANGIYIPSNNCAGSNGRTDDSTIGAIGQLDWDLGFANLVYLGGDHVNRQNDLFYSGSGTDQLITNDRDQWQSHEVRLSNSDGSPIKWVGGAYYYYESARILTTQFPPPGAFAEYDHMPIGPSHSESKATFAQATAPLFWHLRLTGGIRYTKDTKASRQSSYNTPALSDGPPPGTYFYNLTYGKSNVSYKIGAEADLTPTALAYADYSTGYKAGGFYSAIGANTFKPEYIDAYQGGIKSRFLDNRVQINVGGFYYNYTDYQIETINFGQFQPPPAPPGIGLVTVNAQSAHFYGGEVEGVVLLTRDDLLQINYSLLSASLTNFVIPPNPLGPSDLDGYRAPYAPTSSGRVTYRHTLALGGHGKLEGQVQEDFSSGYWVQIQHLAGSYQSSYQRTGADLTYSSLKDHWQVSLWARNLENRATIQSYFFALGNAPSGANISAQPRTYGLRLTANF